MNIYDKTYSEIQIGGANEFNQVADKVVSELESRLNLEFNFGQTSGINKIITLLNYPELRFYLMPILERYNYDYRTALQHIIVNLCYGDYHQIMPSLINYPALYSVKPINKGFILNTKLGTITIYRAHQIFPVRNYALYGKCHATCEQYIRDNQEMSASTGLVDLDFGTKMYHSFIDRGDEILDLAHNALMSKEDYDKLFAPTILNTVRGDILDREEDRINSKESLSDTKSLLLRLALDKQVKR